MQLTKTHLRYLLAIEALARTGPGVSAGAVAKALAVSKPSVTRMMDLLKEKGLLARERYGKVFLTPEGAETARAYRARLEALGERIPRLGLDLTAEEQTELAYLLAASLPEHALPDGA